MIPIVPQLAAQVSYDDLLFPLVGLVCLMCSDLIEQIKAHKPSLKLILGLATICTLTSLVKYAFLPIYLAVVLFLAIYLRIHYKHDLGSFFASLKKQYLSGSKLVKIVLPIALLISVGMFLQRDGVNLVKYHAIEPNCSKVLTVNQCKAYSPWNYNYGNHNKVLSGQYKPDESILTYTQQWFYWMWYRMFFAVNGLTSGFVNYPPLPLPSKTAEFLAFAGFIALVLSAKKVFRRNPYAAFLFTACIVYAFSLYVQGFVTYKYTDQLENMNGRYLLPIMLPLAALIGLAISKILYRNKAAKALKALIASVAVIMFLQGGGLLTFILNSDQSWFWPNSTVVKINREVKKITRHVIKTSSKTNKK
jgi:hypothetical protein